MRRLFLTWVIFCIVIGAALHFLQIDLAVGKLTTIGLIYTAYGVAIGHCIK